MRGTHALGHTRMATESRVTTEARTRSRPGRLCLVHNGSLSNHNRLRATLRREGISFATENDSEVAAGYLAWRLRGGATLQEALEGCLDDLDGFFTFAVGTRDGFAVMRDPIACKPAVIAETDDWVAMASEYRAIAVLPGAEDARSWEPEPGAGVRVGARGGGVSTAVETFDLAETPLRALNQHLHDLAGTSGGHVRVTNTSGAHAVACGIDAEIEVDVDGHVGYYCAGMNKLATVRVHGNAGSGLAENMMCGRVEVTAARASTAARRPTAG